MKYGSRRITNYSGTEPFSQAFASKLISLYTIGKVSTDAWYNKVKKYNYNRPSFSMGTGHFTQLVWKSSRCLGVSVAYNSASTRAIVVGR